MATKKTEQRNSSRKRDYYKAYEEHARTLKTWLVAYGVGALFLFVAHDKAWEKLAAAPGTTLIMGLFIFGVGVQVLMSAINKTSMWACYFGEEKSSFKDSRRYKTASWVSEQFILDVVADIATIVAFGIATFAVFLIFLDSGTVSPEWVD